MGFNFKFGKDISTIVCLVSFLTQSQSHLDLGALQKVGFANKQHLLTRSHKNIRFSVPKERSE